jgi:serine/threonine protein kinase
MSEKHTLRFLREAQNLIELSHANIVKGFEVGHTRETVYFTMEYIDGDDLLRHIKKSGPVPPARVIEIAIQVAEALSYAFSKGKVHRDIKPSNLLQTPNGSIKITDLGLIKGETDPTLTTASIVLGTPYYMSPELVSGCSQIDTRSDIYSLGATLYHLLTGLPPFYGLEEGVIMTKQVTDNIEFPRKIDLPSGPFFRYILTKMVSKQPGMRYQTPGELIEDLYMLDLPDEQFAATKSTQAAQPNDGNTTDMFCPPTRANERPEIHTVLSPEQIHSLMRSDALEESHAPGEVLFYEGENNRDFYVLLSGKCEVLRAGKRLAEIAEPGACYEDIAAILGVKRTATIRSLDQVHCARIPEAKFKQFLIDHPDVQLRLLEISLKRLTDLNDLVEESQKVLSKTQMDLMRLNRQVNFLKPDEMIERINTIQFEINKVRS